MFKCSNVQMSKVKYQMSIRLSFCRSVPPEFLRSFLFVWHLTNSYLSTVCPFSPLPPPLSSFSPPFLLLKIVFCFILFFLGFALDQLLPFYMFYCLSYSSSSSSSSSAIFSPFSHIFSSFLLPSPSFSSSFSSFFLGTQPTSIFLLLIFLLLFIPLFS